MGSPTCLVAASDGAYRPVDMKHHMALEPKDGDGHSSAAWGTVRMIIKALDVSIPQLGKLIEIEERKAVN